MKKIEISKKEILEQFNFNELKRTVATNLAISLPAL